LRTAIPRSNRHVVAFIQPGQQAGNIGWIVLAIGIQEH